MKHPYLFFLAAALLTTLTAGAETLRFRSGTILAAELSASPVTIANLREDAFPSRPNNRAYAVLTVKIDPKRKISIFDYSLEAFGYVCPCVALRENDDFEYTTRAMDGDKVIQLLFEIDKGETSFKPVERLTLKSNLPPKDATYAMKLDFTLKGSFTPIAQIPVTGNFRSKAEK